MLANLSVERRTEAWEKILREPAANDKTVVFVDEIDGQIVAFGACGEQRDAQLKRLGFESEIGSIYVLQAFQRQGIGVALMRALAGTLVDLGYHGLALWVLRENVLARRFYERCGGMTVAEKSDDRGVAVLVEVAYGWDDAGMLELSSERNGQSES
jgi:ribosomal protein S18 acetylase RimI-like enzyme